MRLKLEYRTNLYLSEGISNSKLDTIKKKMEKNPLKCSYYLVTRSYNPKDQLDIISVRQMIQAYYRKNPPYVVGIAVNYEEALSLVKQIVTECYETRGDCILKEYLSC